MKDCLIKNSKNLIVESDRFCQLGKDVIETELEAIHQLKQRIDDQFAKACHLLLACTGRIVVLGMGKSGHIGNKIAATFASTGTPAFFVHPGEANHGDMGMITHADVALVISNSGETPEILSLIPLIKRLAVPFIALSGNPNSTIAKAADVNIDVSVKKEACPLGLAPTASTTATLVMGDALAIALLEARGFTSEDFALYHPGGALGRRLLLRIDNIMHINQEIPIVTESCLLEDALIEMTQKRLGMTLVVNEEGHIKGMFTDGDLRRALDHRKNLQTTRIDEIMTRNCITVSPRMLAAEALKIMETHKISALPVTNETQTPLGVVHIHDILRAGVI
jgi:arabinose-5-phosphate isomerase